MPIMRHPYPTDVPAGRTDEGAHNVIVDVRIVDVEHNLQQNVKQQFLHYTSAYGIHLYA